MNSSLKVVLLGEGCVGKTCLAQRFGHNSFSSCHSSTLQATLASRTVTTLDGASATVHVWDTAGQERFHALGPLYYRDADAAVLVYDISDLDSFRRVRHWVKELRQVVSDEVVIAIVANKMDLDKRWRRVDNAVAGDFARSVGASIHFTSAKANTGIEELFQSLVQKVLQQRSNDLIDGNYAASNEGRQRGIVICDDRPRDHEKRLRSPKCCAKSSSMI